MPRSSSVDNTVVVSVTFSDDDVIRLMFDEKHAVFDLVGLVDIQVLEHSVGARVMRGRQSCSRFDANAISVNTPVAIVGSTSKVVLSREGCNQFRNEFRLLNGE